MQLAVITPETDQPAEAEAANAMLRLGLDRLHIRKPAYQAADYARYITCIDPAYRTRLIIHGAYNLYATAGVGGIHLRAAVQNDPAALAATTGLPRSALSASLHSWQEVMLHGSKYGNIFISPLFDSISKAGYNAAVEPGGIAQAREYFYNHALPCPVITALGGITDENIHVLKSYGYDAAALLGAIWNAHEPVGAFARVLAATK